MNWKKHPEDPGADSTLRINSGCYMKVSPYGKKWGWSFNVVGCRDQLVNIFPCVNSRARVSCSWLGEFDEELDAQQAAEEYLKELYADIGKAIGVVSDEELVDAIIDAAPEAPPVPSLSKGNEFR